MLAAAVALLGVYVAVVGNPTRYIEQIVTQEGTITTDSMVRYHYIAGFFYTLAVGMIVGGLWLAATSELNPTLSIVGWMSLHPLVSTLEPGVFAVVIPYVTMIAYC